MTPLPLKEVLSTIEQRVVRPALVRERKRLQFELRFLKRQIQNSAYKSLVTKTKDKLETIDGLLRDLK